MYGRGLVPHVKNIGASLKLQTFVTEFEFLYFLILETFFYLFILFDVYSLSFNSVFHICREQLKHKDAAAGPDTCGRGGVVRQVSHWCVAEETTYVPVGIPDNMRVTRSNISLQTFIVPPIIGRFFSHQIIPI